MSVFFICVSILSFCLKTHPNLRVPVIRNVTIDWSSSSRSVASSPPSGGVVDIYQRFRHQYPTRHSNWTTSWTLDKTRTEPHQAFFFVELVCICPSHYVAPCYWWCSAWNIIYRFSLIRFSNFYCPCMNIQLSLSLSLSLSNISLRINC